MQEITLESDSGLSDETITQALHSALSGETLQGKRTVLLIVPDYTRLHSNAGKIANYFYHFFESHGIHVDLLEALGTHAPMTQAQCAAMYGDIPFSHFFAHNWRRDTIQIGEIPETFVETVSEGALHMPVSIELNRQIFDSRYGLILSIGQVVPHEVVGMSNESKNLFVGCGGTQMLHTSHILGAVYGMERIMGCDFSPVRRIFDYAQEKFLSALPLCYVLTVTTTQNGKTSTHGLYIGRRRQLFEQAVAQSQRYNLIFLNRPVQKAVVFLDENEFTSTWLGNKAIYRTRMVMADGGELFILAPGVRQFGEDAAMDALIRRYGYCGRDTVLRLCKSDPVLQDNLSAAAHLIHGSTEGRFHVTYCTRALCSDEIESVGYRYLSYDEACAQLAFPDLHDGFQQVKDEKIFYISNPALGLWTTHDRFIIPESQDY